LKFRQFRTLFHKTNENYDENALFCRKIRFFLKKRWLFLLK